MSDEILVDLTNVPIKPLGKKEISQLEMALLIGTLYRPEVLELIKDPIERTTWIDSLAVATAAFARYKAGIPISQISEELGRSEVTVRSHLNQKTKAGKLVAETYEKLKRGELKLIVPFVRAAPQISAEEITALKSELERLKEQNRALEEELKKLAQCQKEVEALRTSLSEKNTTIQTLKDEVELLARERSELTSKYNKLVEDLNKIMNLLLEALDLIKKSISSPS